MDCAWRTQTAALLSEGKRQNGRGLRAFRALTIDFGANGDSATVALGDTVVTAKLVVAQRAPPRHRPLEGSLRFHVNAGALVLAARRAAELQTDAAHVLAQLYRGSRALDLHTLCLLKGVAAYALDVHLHVLNYDGSLFAALSAAVAALFRMFSAGCRLSALRCPLLSEFMFVSFAAFESADGVAYLQDPDAREAQSCDFVLNLAVNREGALAAAVKSGGASVGFAALEELLAGARAQVCALGDALDAQLCRTVVA